MPSNVPCPQPGNWQTGPVTAGAAAGCASLCLMEQYLAIERPHLASGELAHWAHHRNCPCGGRGCVEVTVLSGAVAWVRIESWQSTSGQLAEVAGHQRLHGGRHCQRADGRRNWRSVVGEGTKGLRTEHSSETRQHCSCDLGASSCIEKCASLIGTGSGNLARPTWGIVLGTATGPYPTGDHGGGTTWQHWWHSPKAAVARR